MTALGSACTEAAGTPSPGWYCGQGGRRGHSPWTAARQRKKGRPCDSHQEQDPVPADVSDDEATAACGDDVEMDNIASQLLNVRLGAFDAPASVATTASYSPTTSDHKENRRTSHCTTDACPSDSHAMRCGPFWLPASPFTPPDRGLRHSWAGPTDRVADKPASISRHGSSPTACCAPPATPLTDQRADDVAPRPSRNKGRGPAYRFGLAASLPTVVQRLLRPSGSFRAAEHPSTSSPPEDRPAVASASEEASGSPAAALCRKSSSSCSSPAATQCDTSPAKDSGAAAEATATAGLCVAAARQKPAGEQTAQERYDEYMARADVEEDDDQGFQLFSSLHQAAAPAGAAAGDDEEAEEEEADEGDSTAVERDLFDDEFCEELDGCSQGQFDTSDDFSTPQRLASSSLSPGGGNGGFKARGATMDRGMGAALRAGNGGGGGSSMGFGSYGLSGAERVAAVPLDQLELLEDFNHQLTLAASARDRGRADLVWATLRERGLAPDLRTLNLMVRCFSRCLADPDEAEALAREVCMAGNLSPNATTYDLLAETRMHFDQLWVQ